MDDHSLKVLELPLVLERLASRAATAMGREAALALRPSQDRATVQRRLQETREARFLRDQSSGMPLGGIRDIREPLSRASVEQQLTPFELLEVAQTVEAARGLRAFLFKHAEECPALAEMARGMNLPLGLETQIRTCIADSGEIRDTASPTLARVRADRRQTHQRLMDRLHSILASERYRPLLQEPIITEREGRYTVPVKAEHRAQFGGIVHDVSTSGATVFIEPGPCVELGNKLKELAIKEEQEISRILTHLTGLVSKNVDDLRAALGILAALDLANARAELAEEMRASEPQAAPDGILHLLSARHPLLPEPVVPIDIEVGERFDVLLLTGPNTGGKTVALKTVGLLVAMRQCGMQIPASPESRLAHFDQVFADIGDEQDIQQSLSTFSAHLRNIVGILRTARKGALVLLDEIGAGTDPAEGAALARAILGALQRLGARVLATTHYGELKEYAYATPRVENAAVQFDRDTLRPTYRVLVGVPGSSHAFYIARRLGLPDEIVQEAQSCVGSRTREAGELMEQIERSRQRAAEMEREAAEALRAAEQARKEYERRAREVADIRRTVRSEAEHEARALLRRAAERAENIIAELRKANKGERKAPAARKKLAQLRAEVHEELGAPEEEAVPPPPPEGYAYSKGERVFVTSFGVEGVLLSDPVDGEATVQIGAMRATLPLDTLRPVTTAPVVSVRRPRSRATSIAMQRAMQVGPEVMIRALRVDEAQSLLDRYLDDAYAAGLREVRIVHGKGTGVLRRFVQEYLREHPLVAGQRPAEEGEGGGGATVAILKD